MDINPKGDDLHPFVAALLELTGTDPEDVLSLAVAIDEALDSAQGYGTSVVETSLTSPNKYGEIANLASAAFALAAVREGHDLAEAIHDGWAYSIIFCGDFRSSEDRENRLELVAVPYWLLPEDQQSKDDVAVSAVKQWWEGAFSVSS